MPYDTLDIFYYIDSYTLYIYILWFFFSKTICYLTHFNFLIMCLSISFVVRVEDESFNTSRDKPLILLLNILLGTFTNS